VWKLVGSLVCEIPRNESTQTLPDFFFSKSMGSVKYVLEKSLRSDWLVVEPYSFEK